MDVLVKWTDGTQNVVRSSELQAINKPKTLQTGSEVKMWYEGRMYFGTVLARDDDESEDDLPLLRK